TPVRSRWVVIFHPLTGERVGCGGSAALAVASAVFRSVVHMKVDAVMLSCFVYKKIFQHVLTVCRRERFFADSAMNQVARKFAVGTQKNKLVARCASREDEIDSFSHDADYISIQ